MNAPIHGFPGSLGKFDATQRSTPLTVFEERRCREIATQHEADDSTLREALLRVFFTPLLKKMRPDVHAEKGKNGPVCVKRPLNEALMLRHLDGGPGVGAYPMRPGERTTMVSLFDLDSHKGEATWEEMVEVGKRLYAECLKRDLFPMLFRSSGGHGIHFLCQWAAAQDAYSVRHLMWDTLEAIEFTDGCKGVKAGQIEVFPKQDSIGADGFGNMFILPLCGLSIPLDENFEPMNSEALLWTEVPGCPPVPYRKRPVPAYPTPPEDVDLAELREAVMAIPNDANADVDYDKWWRIGAGIHHATGGSEEGLRLFTEWSEQSPRHNGYWLERRTWPYLKGGKANPITAASIFAEARKHGWTHPDGGEVEARIGEFNERHFVTMAGKTVAVARLARDGELTLFKPADLKVFYANVPPVPVGEKYAPLVDYWLRHPQRRTYEKLVFEPEGDVPAEHYNLWRGWAVQPVEGDCSLYLELLRDVICSGDEELFRWVLAWMAQAVQHPGDRPGTAIAMRGGMGAGKGTAATEFGKLFGRHFVHISSGKHLTGNFNSHLKDTLLVFADEAVWAGDRAGEGVLKALVTEGTITIEGKFQDAYAIRNHVRLLLASNKDWVVPAGLDERRFCVIDVSDIHKQDTAYFGAIKRQMRNGGREALLHHLLHLDIAGVDLRRIPDSAALAEQKTLSLTPIEAWWLGKLRGGRIHAAQDNATKNWWVFAPQLYDEFIASARKRGLSHLPALEGFSIAMRKLCPGFGLKDNRTMFGSRRRRCWALPPLAECRAAFGGVQFDDAEDWDLGEVSSYGVYDDD